MNKRITNAAQAGFTLIELIVVIVILGILAATALPKFSDMSGDARHAAAQGGAGALKSAASIVHSTFLLKSVDPVVIEGGNVSVVHGYPAANTAAHATALQKAAGLEEWTVVNPGATATANAPAAAATEVAFIPPAVAGTTKGLTCYISYTEPTAAGGVPTFKSPTLANCQ